MIIAAVVSVVLAQVGCTKDTDCKGERVCEAGRCVNPSPPTSVSVPTPPPPPPPVVDAGVPEAAPPAVPRRRVPDDYPRIVRRNGDVCVQSLTEEGVVREECRADEPRRIRSPGREAQADAPSPWRRQDEPQAPQRSTFVADFGATGYLGILMASGAAAALPGFGLHAALGGRLSEAFGLVGVIDASFGFVTGLSLFTVTFAPGLRLGDGGHATLAFGPSILAVTSIVGNGSSVGGTILLRGVFVVSGGFGVHTQVGLTFDASGVIIRLELGIGGSTF